MPKKTYDLVKLDKAMQKAMDNKRYLHTAGVRYTAASLAMAHGSDLVTAQVAGLLHDCAKQIPDDEKFKLCKKYKIEVPAFEREHPFLLHARLGAVLAKEKYGVEDPAVLGAIRWHTTGRARMTQLEQIIFIADYIEPGRNKVSELPHLRQFAFDDLDETCYLILKNMLAYLDSKEDEIDETTRIAYDYYKTLHEKAGEED